MLISKTLKIIFMILCLGAGGAPAASISIGKGFGLGVNVMSFGWVVKDFSMAIGTFDIEPAGNASYTEVLAAFKEFGRTSSPLVNGADTIIAVANPITNAPANAADFNGKPIYILIATNGLADTPNTLYGVIKSLNPGPGKWVFPPNVAIADAGDAPMHSAANFQAVIGTRIDNPDGVDTFSFVVPEPTGCTLLLLYAAVTGLSRSRCILPSGLLRS